MVVTYYIKLFRTGADRHNGVLISLLLLVAETTNTSCYVCLACLSDEKQKRQGNRKHILLRKAENLMKKDDSKR